MPSATVDMAMPALVTAWPEIPGQVTKVTCLMFDMRLFVKLYFSLLRVLVEVIKFVMGVPVGLKHV